MSQSPPPIYRVQDAALTRLMELPILRQAKLCGGTALARCYLDHRVSYDLDLFLPAPFDPVAFAVALKQAGLKARALEMVVDDTRANQWHGMLLLGDAKLKLSAVEDAYFEVYPSVEMSIGGTPVRTESVEGLYHRKLLTITHASPDGVTATGGRQTARDLFDLWVLSQKVSPLQDFIATVPYDYPLAAFEDGLDNMDWFGLVQEFQQIQAAPQWQSGCDVAVVRKHLFSQLGVDEDEDEDAEPEPADVPVAPPTRKSRQP